MKEKYQKAYLALFKLRFNIGLQYRIAAIAGVFTQIFWGFTLIMIYKAFYKNGSNSSISIEQLISFVWLQQSFFYITKIWIKDSEICNMIVNGNIAYELLRPVDIYSLWYFKSLAVRISGTLLRCVPVLTIAVLLPQGYNLLPPESILSLFLCIITLILGVLLITSIIMLIYISMFYTLSIQGSLIFFAAVSDFLAGGIIPIPLMPEWAQKICYILPFRWSGDLSFRIYSGNIGTEEALFSILVQIFWITTLVLLGRFILKKSLKNVVVQGG